MLIALLIAGIGFLLAGLLGIAAGLPEKEFSFGNTEILAGVITACTGIVMLGLWMVVRELRVIAGRLGADALATPRTAFALPDASPAPHDQTPESDSFLFNQPGATHPADAEPAAPASAPLPWHEETAARDRVRSEMPQVLPGPLRAQEVASAAKPKRNLLFSSTSRRERERAEERTVDPATVEVAPPLSKANEPPPATFEEAWPQPERARPSDAPVRRSGRTPSTFAEGNAGAAGADRHPPAERNDELPSVTVLKSGVVDGMAYSLYSDGSIEAQMPEGMMRFASIDELRAHLDQRG
jgi:hypothetical protein